MLVERVDPLAAAEEASAVLREAWPPPALHYTADYLRWQLGFPGPGALAAMAREGGEPAGFIGLAPRRLRFRGAETDGYILSFVAVRPKFQGRGVAGALYAEAMKGLRASGLPAVVFVEARAAPAQRAFLGAVERHRFKVKRLSPCQGHGAVLRAGAAPPQARAAPATGLEEVLAAMATCRAEHVLWAAPGRAQLEHLLRDPRPRRLLVVEEDGQVVGAAAALRCEIATARGIERTAQIDALFLPEPTADRLAALLHAARDAFDAQAGGAVVSAPNLATVPPAELKGAGLRPTGACYDAFVVHAGGHPCLDAEVTNLEVV